MSAAQAVRLFGKLPTHGDFVARGLPAADRECWDAWLSASLATAQVQLGETFAERYDAAQPWRFARDGWAGALAPSTDTTGRRFPLLLAVEAGSEAAASAAADCETLLYDAIVGGWTVETLVERAAALTPTLGKPSATGWWIDGIEAPALPESQPADLLLAMLSVAEPAA